VKPQKQLTIEQRDRAEELNPSLIKLIEKIVFAEADGNTTLADLLDHKYETLARETLGIESCAS
jgi:hypothetical protein